MPRAPTGVFALSLGLWLGLLCCAGAASGCQTARPDALPSVATQPNPRLAAQTTLIREARAHLTGGRAAPAVELLQNLIARHPDSPLLPEMRWWLGRAHELAGNAEAAAARYRDLIRDTPAADASHRRLIASAQRRLATLTPIPDEREPAPTMGLLVAPADVPARPDRAAWVDALARGGIRALVLEAGSPPGDLAARAPGRGAPDDAAREPRAGVYFRTSWAPVIDDLFEQLLPVAQERGLAVYAALSLRRLSWLEPPAGWADMAYDPEQGVVRRTLALDLFHPGYQQYLEGLLLDLIDSGVNGVIFRATHPLGPTDGLSAFARHAFERAFQLPVEPHRWFQDREAAPAEGPANDRLIFEPPDRHPPAYWRWVGWKARERLAVITRLAERIRDHRDDATVSLEVHAAAVVDPTDALVANAEDVVAIAHAGFDHVLVPFAAASAAASSAAGIGQDEAALDTPATGLARLIEMLGDPSRLWLVRPLEVPTIRRIGQPSLVPFDRPAVPRAVGILLVPSPAALP